MAKEKGDNGKESKDERLDFESSCNEEDELATAIESEAC